MMGSEQSKNPQPKPPPLTLPPDPSKSIEATTSPLPEPPVRHWKTLPGADASPENTFTVATYNVMADIWSPPHCYPHIPPWAVVWAYRGRLILREISDLKPDILCMQELGLDAQKSFTSHMSERDYDVLYKPNPSGEGCAIYWNKKRFELVQHVLTDCNTLAKERIDTNTAGGVLQDKICRSMFNLSHHNVFVLALLRDKITKREALVISTHLFWGGAAHWNRQVQMMQAILVLDLVNSMFPDALPAVFFCGDFNARCPPAESGLYLLLHNGVAPKDNKEWTMEGERKDLADQSPEPAVALCKRTPLVSTYGLLGHEQPFTHSARGWSSTIDYIYSMPAKVKAQEILQVFDKSEMPHGLPTLHYGGDHICLCARFKFV